MVVEYHHAYPFISQYKYAEEYVVAADNLLEHEQLQC